MAEQWGDSDARRRFGRASVISATAVLKGLQGAGYDRFTLMLGREIFRSVQATSMNTRALALAMFIDKYPDEEMNGKLVSDIIVLKACELCQSRHLPNVSDEELEEFKGMLRLEGFSAEISPPTPILPDPVDGAVPRDELTSLLVKFKFNMTLNHLRQSLEAHSRGDWESANAQLRSFFEALLDEISVKLGGSALSGEARVQNLASINPPFLKVDLNEWGNDGKNYINGLRKRLHPAGSHAGVSDEGDCTFRVRQVLTTSHYLMLRLNERLKPPHESRVASILF